MTRWTLLLGIVAVLALTGCEQGQPEFSPNEQVAAEDRTEAATEGATEGGGEQAANTLAFVAVDIAFEQAPTGPVPAGEYTVELTNNGAVEHNVVFDALGEEPVVVAPPGETATGTVTLEAGEYRFHCSVPGHEALMNGTLVVE